MTGKLFSKAALLWLKIKIAINNPQITRWVLANFAGIDDFLNTGQNELISKGWPEPLLGLLNKARKCDTRQAARELTARHINLVCIEDDLYPPLLKTIADPPALLFYKGDLSCLHDKTVSIVGSRNCTRQGTALASKMANILAECAYTVVSGLASGIDTSAHSGAIKAGKTAAILACGLDICFPFSNRLLFEKIASTGCLVSEHLLKEKPLKHHFPYRNRIISGLSPTLIVIEAGQKSGALITANSALEQGREVLASPGSPGHLLSKGCNQLIKDGAFLIDDLEDLDYFFELNTNKKTGIVSDPLIELLQQKPCKLDELSILTKQTTPSLLARLTQLEIERLISKDERNRYFANP